MKDQIEKLVELQGIEDEVLLVKEDLNGVDEKLGVLEEKLTDVSSELEAEKRIALELKKKQQDLEAEIDDIRALNKKSKDRLNSITNNREFKALTREVEDGQKRISDLENEMVEIMEKIEVSDNKTAKLLEEHQSLQETTSQEKQALDGQKKQSDKKLKALYEKKNKVAKGLDSQWLKVFDEIIEQSAGKAVAPVISCVCRGCNVNIPPQMFNELQRQDEIRFCPHCDRIIYFKAQQ